MFLALALFLLGTELVWQIVIAYPPTTEQLGLGILNPYMLWGGRVVSLVLLLAAIFFLSRIIPTSARRYYWILLLASPTLSLLWMSYPIDILKIFLISFTLFLLNTVSKRWMVVTGISISILFFVNLGIFNQNPIVLKTLSIDESQKEVTYRFTTEDNLNPHIEVPTWIRRIGYNKFFLSLKNSVNESLPFLNFETLFFQEVHPQGQKATIMFLWPEVIIFALSIWYLSRGSLNIIRILPILLLSFAYFITTNTSIERRLILALWPIALIMALGIDTILRSPSKGLKIGISFLLLLTFYGWITNVYDRYTRPAHWLDNRPLTYQFFLTSLKNQDLEKYRQIIVPDTLHATKQYCPYYLQNCTLFKHENFDLSKEAPQPDVLYIGFVGNFLGPNGENTFPADFQQKISERGLEILAQTHIRDNIAHGYGQELLIVRAKQYEKNNNY